MFEDRDSESAFRLFNDRAVQKYLSPRNRRTREQMSVTLKFFLKRWTERGFGLWRVGEKNGGKMLGYCGFQYFDETLEVEILFALFEECWGKGLATEAAKAGLKFGFEKLLLSKIFAVVHPENSASRGVLEKIGMRFENTTLHYGIDTMTYSISSDDFKSAEIEYKLTYKTLPPKTLLQCGI